MPPEEKKDANLKDGEKSNAGVGYNMTLYIGPCEQQGGKGIRQGGHTNKNNSKEIRLPYADMMVSPKPHNPMSLLDQKRYKGVTFSVQVSGLDKKTLIVTRTDCNKGWGFDLQLKAYYTKKSIGTHHKEFDFKFKNEDSAVTISLRPLQKIRCVPEALIFTDRNVTTTVAEVADSTSKRSGIRGRLSGIRRSAKSKNSNTVAEYASASSKMENELATNTFAEYSYLGSDTSGVVILGGYSSKIVHLSLGEHGNKIIFKKGTCLATSADLQVVESGLHLDGSFQSLVGYGDVFLKVGMAMKKIILQDDQDSLSVKDNCVIAFTQDMRSKSEMTDKFCGIILSKRVIARTLIGPGTVWLSHTRADILGYERMGMIITSGLGEGMVLEGANMETRTSATKMIEEKDSVTSSDLLSFASNDWDVEHEERLEAKEEARLQRQRDKIEAARLRAEVGARLQELRARQAETGRLQAEELVGLQKQKKQEEKLRVEQAEAARLRAEEGARLEKQKKQDDELRVKQAETARIQAEERVGLQKQKKQEEKCRAEQAEAAHLQAEQEANFQKQKKREEKHRAEQAKATRLRTEEEIRLQKQEEKCRAEQAEAARLQAEERVRLYEQKKQEGISYEQAEVARLRAEIEARLKKQKKEEDKLRAMLARLQAEERTILQKQKKQEEKLRAEQEEAAHLRAEIEAKLQKQKHKEEEKLKIEKKETACLQAEEEARIKRKEEDTLEAEQADSLSTVPVGYDSVTGWQIDDDASVESRMPVDYVIVTKQSEDSEGEITLRTLKARHLRLFGSKKYPRKVGNRKQKSDITVSTRCTSTQSSKAASVMSTTSSLAPNAAQLRLYLQSEPMQEEGRQRRKTIEEKNAQNRPNQN
jgi:uncharacterized protein (AIM24 family)